MSAKAYITLDLEPIVKLRCLALDCRFNGAHRIASGEASCELKYIEISAMHDCMMYEHRDKKQCEPSA